MKKVINPNTLIKLKRIRKECFLNNKYYYLPEYEYPVTIILKPKKK